MRPVRSAWTQRQESDFHTGRSPARQGRILAEVALIVLTPCLLLGALCLCDSETRNAFLSRPPATPMRLTNSVTGAVRIDPDQALTVQQHGQIRLWSFLQSAELGEMQSHIPDVCCVAYSPQERLLALGSKTGQLEVWDLDHAETPVVNDDADDGQINDCQFTPDGKTLLTTSLSGQIILWEPRSLKRRATWQVPGSIAAIRSLAVSADGQLLLAGTFLGQVQVWDLGTGQHLRTHQISAPATRIGPDTDANLSAVAFIPGDQEFIAASEIQGVGVWNMATGANVRRFEGDLVRLKNGVISPDGRRFTAGMMDGMVVTWDTATGKQIGAVKRHTSTVKCLLYSADGRSLLTGDWNGHLSFDRN